MAGKKLGGQSIAVSETKPMPVVTNAMAITTGSLGALQQGGFYNQFFSLFT